MSEAFTTTPESRLSVHFSSESSEHYTPAGILDAVVACLGGIELDPCSNPEPFNVPARRHFTKADNGLLQPWGGTVFMNPPYGRSIGEWVSKAVQEYRSGRVEAAILLLPSRTDTKWFRLLEDFPVCFVKGRLTFIGSSDPAPFPSCLFYLGRDVQGFVDAFQAIGNVWARVQSSAAEFALV